MLSLAASAALALAACDGDKGDPGPQGPQGPQGPAGPPGDTTGTPQDVGAGVVFDIQSATVAEGAAPTVTFRVRDADGAPIDLKAESVAGTFRPTVVLSKLGADGKWNSYLTRSRNGASYVEDGVTKQPVLASATQATGQGICSATPCNDADQARLVANGDGVFTYTFSAPVTGVDPAATHRVGLYGSRTFEGVGQPGSNTFDFVPAGGTPTERDVVTDAACNRCHTVVNAHGGSRRGVKLCLTCHSPQTVDPETGNDVDMARMIHKIHKGKLLAHGYTIIGNSQSVHDFSHVAMGPSHSTYFEVTGGTLGPGSDRGIVRECARCHEGAQGDRHQTAISTATCTGCHDDANPGQTPVTQPGGVTVAPGVGHGSPVSIGAFPEAACVGCHGAAPAAFPVAKVHSVNYETVRNLEFAEHSFGLKIDAVRDFLAGGATPPSIDFTLTLDGQPFNARANAAKLGALAFQIAGPITDYAETLPSAFGTVSGLSSGALNARVTDLDAAAGKFRFTFAAPTPPATVIPAGRTGTYVVSFESYYKDPQVGSDGATVAKPFAADPIFHDNTATSADERNVKFVNVATGADVTGSGNTRTERRKIVSNDKCNNCHEDLGFHSNRSRQGVDYCATCHNPNLSNASRSRFKLADMATPTERAARGELGLPGSLDPAVPVFIAESVSTNVFIHKIHMGAELSKPYMLGTNRTSTDRTPGAEGLADFSQFEAPSPMGNCQTCHDGETYKLPETPALLPVKQAILTCPVQDPEGWCSGPLTGPPTPPATTPPAGSFSNVPNVGTLSTPPQKAVCMGCHDTAADSAHADLNTLNPMTVGAVETCSACHGAGKDFDAIKMHPPVLAPTVDLPD
jgi:OmcA/MtrC family decaheme c-type cytochrome